MWCVSYHINWVFECMNHKIDSKVQISVERCNKLLRMYLVFPPVSSTGKVQWGLCPVRSWQREDYSPVFSVLVSTSHKRKKQSWHVLDSWAGPTCYVGGPGRDSFALMLSQSAFLKKRVKYIKPSELLFPPRVRLSESRYSFRKDKITCGGCSSPSQIFCSQQHA